ncbi:u31-Nephitoxin-Nsp1c_1 [Trichonephila inaurata madagascariensis]|uniref:U31-Nephitoxin-Nsp1c_1 n=1 Tax=Trichonephila inaurata madagascariensis TaxID=2747483 RepID=A0A8X7BQM4_9ARAC|nr:u31-Nephitoxin-Nsp1c_1 [Trichonephila inaurata madagascariensis]
MFCRIRNKFRGEKSSYRLDFAVMVKSFDIDHQSSSDKMKYFTLLTFVVLTAVASAEDVHKAFELLGCKGTYDETKLRQVARVCDECYELYHEDTIRTLCADKCFSTIYYTGCVESIGQTESAGIYETMVAELSGQ